MTPREQLIRDGFVIDPPLVSRRHNQWRKDTQLSPEQQESLRNNFQIQTTFKNKEGKIVVMMEKDVLSSLRSQSKAMDKKNVHKPTVFATTKEISLGGKHKTWKQVRKELRKINLN